MTRTSQSIPESPVASDNQRRHSTRRPKDDDPARRYSSDELGVLDAQRRALEIVFGPVSFQVARILRKFGVLKLLSGGPGMSLDEVCQALERPKYPVQVLLEAALGCGLIYRRVVDPQRGDRLALTKAGTVMLQDSMVDVLVDFMQDVCYRGMLDLECAMETGRPEGLRHAGGWPTIYQGLAELPEPMRGSWLRYDHYFSDCTFEAALQVVFDPPPQTLLDVGGNTGKWALECVGYDGRVEVTVMDLHSQIALLEAHVADAAGSDRIRTIEVDLLDPVARIPEGFDVIWMSQFLDCFSDTDITRVLRLASRAMTPDTRLYINEIYWDRQCFETASFVLTQSSPYFTAMANGQSKFLYWPDMERCIKAAGLCVELHRDGLGWGHTLSCCRLDLAVDTAATS